MASPKIRSEQLELDSEECARIYLKQAMAHHCVAQGFAITTDGVLECLADVVRRPVSVSDYLDFCLNISQSFSPLLCFGQGGLISPGGGLCQAQRFVEETALRTMESTNRAGRSQANIADGLQGLLQQPVPVKWTELNDFAWDNSSQAATNSPDGCGEESTVGGGDGTKAEGGKERVKRWDQPFHSTVPPLPLPRKRPAPEKECVPDTSVRPPHVPSFLPAPPVGRKESSEASEKETAADRLDRLKRRRWGQIAVRNLHPPLPGSSIDASFAAAAPTADAGSTGGGSVGGRGPTIKFIAKSRGSSTVSAVTESSPSGGVTDNLSIPISKKRRKPDDDGERVGGSKGEAGNAKRPAGASARSANGSVGIRPHAISGSGARGGESSVRMNGARSQVTQGRPQERPKGFRSIPPKAAVASKRMGPSAKAAAAAAATSSTSGGAGSGFASKKSKLWKGSGSGARGSFGRASDLSKEERILEGIPPDGHQGDFDGGGT